MDLLERARKLADAHEALIGKYGRPLANLLVHGAQMGFWIDAAAPTKPIRVPTQELADVLDNFQTIFQAMLDGTNMMMMATVPLLLPEGKEFNADEINADVKNIYDLMIGAAEEGVEAVAEAVASGATIH